MLTPLCKFIHFKPQFHIIIKCEFTGVYIMVSFFLQNIDCGYSLEPPQSCTRNLCFEQIYKKVSQFSTENCHFYSLGITAY